VNNSQIAEFGISKNGKTCVVSWVRKPCNDSIGDCSAINVASLQLSQKLRSIYTVAYEHKVYLDNIVNHIMVNNDQNTT
jgi:hypothetical protein